MSLDRIIIEMTLIMYDENNINKHSLPVIVKSCKKDYSIIDIAGKDKWRTFSANKRR